MSNLTTWLTEASSFWKTFTPRALMQGDPAKIAGDLREWCRRNGVTLITFGEGDVRIESASGRIVTVGWDVTTLESITARIASFLVVAGTLCLPEQVHESLSAKKCVFFYENLWNMDPTARHRILCGVLRPDNLQQYDSKNLIAHVAALAPGQKLSDAESAQNYFSVIRDWKA